ncbi:MAG: hypothetical protein HQL32_01170 [Planctomycetes bacterium]|nr:hypothetical protein [Planctomycetota bacterium]
MKPFSLFAVTPPGLEDLAEEELKELGFKGLKPIKGGIEFSAHWKGIILCNNYARIISRVLIRLESFKALHFKEFVRKLSDIDWAQFLTLRKICIRVHCNHCKLYHSDALKERLLNFLKHSIGIDFTEEPSPTNDSHLIIINGQDDVFSFSLDTSGAHLHERGVMKFRAHAPLRENLAAAMVRASDYNLALWDPMCGSGTIALEYALFHLKTPLNAYRKFSYECFAGYDKHYCDKFLSEKEDCAKNTCPKIIASDIDENALECARKNIAKAGLDDYIHFEQHDVNQGAIDSIIEGVQILANPPYGHRLEHFGPALKSLEMMNQHIHIEQVACLLPHSFKQKHHEVLLTTRNGGLKVSLLKVTR